VQVAGSKLRRSLEANLVKFHSLKIREAIERLAPGSYVRLIDACITQLKAQETSRTCNESKEQEEEPRV